jgi:hypothetical protein
MGETDELVNNNGEEDTNRTRPDNGEDLAPATTGNDDMLDHKFDDGKTVASVGNVFSPRMETRTIDAGRKPDSISAVSFGSENQELQQELVAMQTQEVGGADGSGKPTLLGSRFVHASSDARTLGGRGD